MRVLPIVALLALLALPAQAAAPQPVAGAEPLTGKWQFRGRLGRLHLLTTCEFTQIGTELRGYCRDNASGGAPKPLTSGSVRGDRIRFSYDTGYGTDRFKARYYGRLTDGIINQGYVRTYEVGGRIFGYRAG